MDTSKPGTWRGLPLVIVVSNLVLWGLSLTYLATAQRTYDSRWAITLPSAEENTRITLPEIGAATSEVRSPFEARNQDPREIYKFIATGASVRNRASEISGIPVGEFRSLRAEIIDNSTLLQFSVEGTEAARTYEKAQVLQEAFTDVLAELRAEETQRRRVSIEASLEAARDELEQSQQAVSAYKSSVGLVSGEQIVQLSGNIEDLLIARATLAAQQQQADARLNELSSSLQISREGIRDAFLLEADEVFRQNLLEYSEATRRVSVLDDQLGPNHPTLVREAARQSSSQAAMIERAQQLLGYAVNETAIAQLLLRSEGGGVERGNLFQETLIAGVDNEGLAAQLGSLDEQITVLEGRLRGLAAEESTLAALNRDVDIAEAVFTSHLTRLNSLSGEAFGSYPPVQVVSEPSEASEPSSPQVPLVLLGTVVASALLTLALASLAWQRRRLAAAQNELPLQVKAPSQLQGVPNNPH